MSKPVKRWGADEIDAGLVGGEFVLLADHSRAMAEKDAEHERELTALKARCEGMREALEFDERASEAAEQHDCGGNDECTYAGIGFKGCFHDKIWDDLKEAKAKKKAALTSLPVEGLVERVAK